MIGGRPSETEMVRRTNRSNGSYCAALREVASTPGVIDFLSATHQGDG